MTKLYQIPEGDLQKLEHALPAICSHCYPLMNRPELQVLFEEVKEIVSNIRWNYGPPTQVEVLPAVDDR